jgi:hypothetical protein
VVHHRSIDRIDHVCGIPLNRKLCEVGGKVDLGVRRVRPAAGSSGVARLDTAGRRPDVVIRRCLLEGVCGASRVRIPLRRWKTTADGGTLHPKAHKGQRTGL